MSLHWTVDGIEERDFLIGFNRDGKISGRPVDVAQGPDGSIYISDDYAGAIYRVRYDNTGKGNSRDSAIATASNLDDQPPAWLENADLAAMANNGSKLYQRFQCASCHEDGENPKRLDGLVDRLGYEAVTDVLEAPQSPMPQFPLSKTERRDLAVFLLWRPPVSD